jgi:hypothetical protein
MAEEFVVAMQSATADAMMGDLSAPKIALNLQRSINRTAEKYRTESAREIRTQVNFPASYLAPSNGRLTVTKHADSDDLSAVITGRHRPTSLARFAVSTKNAGQRGARVSVQPGLASFLPRAFFVNLRSGNTDTKNNVGLAIRLPAGKRPSAAYKPTELAPGLWLLYAPSVDQVFDDVAGDLSPAAAEFLEAEFLRLMGLN